MSKLQKWKLLSSTDVSPSPWFPIENRTYQLPDGRIVDDFTVTTLADVAMIVPVTKDGRVIAVRQYKPGVDQITIEFPAGRMEKDHGDIEETAIHELEEETGIRVDQSQLQFLGVTAPFVTKATEKVYCYLVKDVEINSTQHFDTFEHIEVVYFSVDAFEKQLYETDPIPSVTVVAWELAKRKFPMIFEKK